MIRLGVIGLGAAGQAFLPAIAAHPGFRLAAVCDARADPVAEAAVLYGARGYTSVEGLLGDGALDAIYIGTPTDLHLAHATAALEAGFPVLLEKPMAVTSIEAHGLADLAAARGLALTVGHSHSHDLPIREMRRIIASGRLGAPRMINTWAFTDWVYRPRRPEELRPDLGGGVTFRQGAHQFDILCALALAPVSRVKAQVFDFDPARRTTGAHCVMLDFENGVAGSAVYNGYGFFQTAELTGGSGEWGFPHAAPGVHPRRAAQADPAAELARKQARARGAIRNDAPFQPQFGLTLASCEAGDLRQSPEGLILYTDAGREELVLPTTLSPRHLVLDEFAAAVAGETVLHDARHGAAVIAICEAVHRSAEEGREIALDRHGPPAGAAKGGAHGHDHPI